MVFLRLPRALRRTALRTTARTLSSIAAMTVVAPVLVVLAASGCDTAEPHLTGQIRIATGSPGAVYHRYGTAYAQILRERLPDVETSILTTAASGENVAMVERGSAEIGFTQADIVTMPASGSVVALARLYNDCLHLVVRADDQIRSITDLRGRSVSVGEIGSGTEVTAARLLSVTAADPAQRISASDMRIERLSLGRSVTALRNHLIDAFFFSGGPPVDLVANLANEIPIRLIDLEKFVTPMGRAFGYHYIGRLIPTTVYGLPPAVSIGIPNYLVVSRSMPESTAYALTKALFAGHDALARAHPAGASLNLRDAISTPPLPLHPGAAQYYRSVKTGA